MLKVLSPHGGIWVRILSMLLLSPHGSSHTAEGLGIPWVGTLQWTVACLCCDNYLDKSQICVRLQTSVELMSVLRWHITFPTAQCWITCDTLLKRHFQANTEILSLVTTTSQTRWKFCIAKDCLGTFNVTHFYISFTSMNFCFPLVLFDCIWRVNLFLAHKSIQLTILFYKFHLYRITNFWKSKAELLTWVSNIIGLCCL